MVFSRTVSQFIVCVCVSVSTLWLVLCLIFVCVCVLPQFLVFSYYCCVCVYVVCTIERKRHLHAKEQTFFLSRLSLPIFVGNKNECVCHRHTDNPRRMVVFFLLPPSHTHTHTRKRNNWLVGERKVNAIQLPLKPLGKNFKKKSLNFVG